MQLTSPFLALGAMFGGMSIPPVILLGFWGIEGRKLLKRYAVSETRASGRKVVARAKAEKEQLCALRSVLGSLVDLSNTVGVAVAQGNTFMLYGKTVGQKHITLVIPNAQDCLLFCSGHIGDASLGAIQGFMRRVGGKACIHSPSTGTVVLIDGGKQVGFSGHKISPYTDYRFISILPAPPQDVPIESVAQANTPGEIFWLLARTKVAMHPPSLPLNRWGAGVKSPLCVVFCPIGLCNLS